MQWKTPKNTEKYLWTAHVSEKMHFYGLSEQKVLGVIRRPTRIETGIVEDTVAVMTPVGNISKGIAKPKWGRPSFAKSSAGEAADASTEGSADTWNQEIWVMYQLRGPGIISKFEPKVSGSISPEDIKKMEKMEAQFERFGSSEQAKKMMRRTAKKLIIISAWRYPGVSPKNNPIPEEILREIEVILA